MRPPRVRFSVRTAMAAVVLLGLGLAVFRTHPLAGGLLTAVTGLALARTARVGDQLRRLGLRLTPAGAARTFAASLGVAAGIFLAALLPGAVLLTLTVPESMGSIPDYSPGQVAALTAGAVLATLIVLPLRRCFW